MFPCKHPTAELRDIRTCPPQLCAALHLELFGKEAWSARSFEELFNLPSTFGGCLVEKNIFLGLYVAQSVLETCELLTLGVLETFRGQGNGTLLVESFLSVAIKKKARSLFLEVRKDNLFAVSLYLKKGFSIIGERVGYYNRKENKKANALTMGRFI